MVVQVENECCVRVTHGEVFELVKQLALTPPDGFVTIREGGHGSMHAEWTYRGKRAGIGFPPGS